jgi:hypothetical protein
LDFGIQIRRKKHIFIRINNSDDICHLANHKEYIGDKFRIERMLSREVESIKFLRSFGIENIPDIVEIQYESGLIVYRWIDGKEPRPDSKSMDELVNFCISLKEIHNLSNSFENSIDVFEWPTGNWFEHFSWHFLLVDCVFDGIYRCWPGVAREKTLEGGFAATGGCRPGRAS